MEMIKVPNKPNTAPQTLKNTTGSNEKILHNPLSDKEKNQSIFSEKITLQDAAEMFGSLLRSILQAF